MSCNEKYSNMSISTTNAKEVDYEGKLAENTKITDECVSQHDVNVDMYSLIDEAYTELSTADLGDLSITFPTTLGVIRFKDVIAQYEIEIANLKEEVRQLKDSDVCDIDITSCGIDFGTLEDECSNTITTLGETLKAIINKINIE